MITNSPTNQQFTNILAQCKHLFEQKNKDYGTAWRVLRPSSLTDQIYIKAQRIRTIQEKNTQKIEDNFETEFMGIINYSLMALIQLNCPNNLPQNLTPEQAINLYNQQSQATYQLMTLKNHDYGEAWRNMRISSDVDLILMKLLRIKQIEDNNGQTIVSEGLNANYYDIINYAVFALIKLGSDN